MLAHIWNHQWKEFWGKLKALCTTQPSKKEENVPVVDDHVEKEVPEAEQPAMHYGLNMAEMWRGDNIEKRATTHTTGVLQWRGVNEHHR